MEDVVSASAEAPDDALPLVEAPDDVPPQALSRPMSIQAASSRENNFSFFMLQTLLRFIFQLWLGCFLF